MSQLMLATGPTVPPPVELREEQRILKKEIYDCVRQGYRRIQVVAPCGFGKSRLAAALIRDILYKEKKALFLVHAKCLVEQTLEELGKHKIFAGAICAGMREYRRYNVQVAMVQTLERRKQKLWFEPDIVIADEVHELGFRGWFVATYPRLKEDGTPVSSLAVLAPELEVIGFETKLMVDGLKPWPTLSECQSYFRQTALKSHPDHGGTNEAMRIVNESWDEIRKHKHLFKQSESKSDNTQPPLLIGLTATPWRLSKRQSMGDIFPVQVVGPTPGEMVKVGYKSDFTMGLVPFIYWGIPGADTKEIRIVRGEFDQGQLDEAFSVPEVILCAVNNYKSKADGRRFICFPTTVHHAKLLVHGFDKAGIPCALITGDTSNKARNIIFKQVKEKRLMGIVSVGCVGIGFDLPEISCIIDCAPTMSRAKFVQGAGRGQRIAPWDGKTDCIYLDQAGNVERFGFIEDVRYGGLRQGKKVSKGETLVKACPQCGHYLTISLMTCSVCQYQFPAKHKEPSVGEMRLLLSKDEEVLFDAFRSLLKTAYSNYNKPDWAVYQLNKFYKKHPLIEAKQRRAIPGKKGQFWPVKGWYYHAIFDKSTPENTRLYLAYLKEITKREVKLEWWYEYQLSREFGDNWRENL